MKMRIVALAAAAALWAGASTADEIEDAIEAALEAYRAGDIATTREELGYAQQLLAQRRADALSGLLPEPLQGWTREVDENAGAAAFGGGVAASATYRRDGETVEIQIVADNQMVAAMAAMFANPAMMGAAGRVKRINRQKVVLAPDGEIQALIDGRVLVTISGSAPIEEKEAYFAAIDLERLKEL